jgi:hypothetical protein
MPCRRQAGSLSPGLSGSKASTATPSVDASGAGFGPRHHGVFGV